MSRSIHTTRKTFADLQRCDFADPSLKRILLLETVRKLRTKRGTKDSVAAERRRPPPPLGATCPDTIPIEVLDEQPFVHHGATAEDLRHVLRALPSAAIEGIARVQLSLGKAYMEKVSEPWETPDPHTGRVGSELFPGVYAGPYFGTFRPSSGLISVYAFVWDQNRSPLPPELCALYLRLHALQTFVHEVAHHHDECRRQARGRWLKLRKQKIETYAGEMEFEWTRSVVIPYLEAAYGRDVKRLRAWVAWHGGLRVPSAFFAGDSRSSSPPSRAKLTSSTAAAFESWLGKLHECTNHIERRLALAWELHFADEFDQCLQIVRRALVLQPKNINALTCLADTLTHLEQYGEALVAATQILSFEPANAEGWRLKARLAEKQSDWNSLLAVCREWRGACAGDKEQEPDILFSEAVAYCALGRDSDLDDRVAKRMALQQYASAEEMDRCRSTLLKRIAKNAGR